MRVETVPGIELFVCSQGQGEPVVLLHGHSLDLRVFDEVVPALVGAGFEVIRYDQRGHGQSSSPPKGYGWGDHARDLRSVLAHLGHPSAHLVGLSKGGGIALEAAVRFPELARSLVLVGPLVPDYPLPGEFWAFFKAFGKAIRERGVEAATRELWLPHPLLRSAWENPRTRPLLEAMVTSFPAGEYLATQRDVPDRQWKLTDRLGSVSCPTLVLRGERDTPEFAEMATFVASSIAGAKLALVPDSGHLVPLEQPEAFVKSLLAFIGRRATGVAEPGRFAARA